MLRVLTVRQTGTIKRSNYPLTSKRSNLPLQNLIVLKQNATTLPSYRHPAHRLQRKAGGLLQVQIWSCQQRNRSRLNRGLWISAVVTTALASLRISLASAGPVISKSTPIGKQRAS